MKLTKTVNELKRNSNEKLGIESMVCKDEKRIREPIMGLRTYGKIKQTHLRH